MWVTAEASGLVSFDVRFLTSVFGLGADFGGKAIDCEAVAIDAEAAERCKGGHGRVGVMTEALAGVDVADMHFHSRNLHRDQRVMQRDRGVRIAAGVDDDAGRLLRM